MTTKRTALTRDDLENFGGIIFIKGPKPRRCLGDLLHSPQHGTYCPDHGRVDVTPDEASMHNLEIGRARVAHMNANGHALLYLVDGGANGDGMVVQDWSGTFRIKPDRVRKGRHNIGRTRWDVWFTYEGQRWHGVNVGDNQILRCRVLRRAALRRGAGTAAQRAG